MSQNLQNFAKFQKCQLDNLVDFEKCCKARIFLQKSVPIQPKTSNILPKFCRSAVESRGAGREDSSDATVSKHSFCVHSGFMTTFGKSYFASPLANLGICTGERANFTRLILGTNERIPDHTSTLKVPEISSGQRHEKLEANENKAGS